MKIAIVGSHGTGKTTLSRGIAKSLNYNLISDVVPDAFRLNFPINENTPPETQFWILSKQLELERNTPEPWIMEKSLWDNIVYGSFSIKDSKVMDVISDIVYSNANYDIVFYLPIQFPIPYDGLRSLNKEFQEDVDKGLRKILKEKNIEHIELKGNEEETLKKAIEVIKSKTKDHDFGIESK